MLSAGCGRNRQKGNVWLYAIICQNWADACHYVPELSQNEADGRHIVPELSSDGADIYHNVPELSRNRADVFSIGPITAEFWLIMVYLQGWAWINISHTSKHRKCQLYIMINIPVCTVTGRFLSINITRAIPVTRNRSLQSGPINTTIRVPMHTWYQSTTEVSEDHFFF